MNCGLGNLTLLKNYLLPPGQAEKDTFDDVLPVLGRGVAGMMEKFCDRKFARVAGDVFRCDGNKTVVILPRYPVEAITKLEFTPSPFTDFTELVLASTVSVFKAESGLVEFPNEPGEYGSLLRFTYTAGFWFDESEDASGEQPEGAAALPPELQTAWLRQCEHVWSLHQKLGVDLADSKSPLQNVIAQEAFHPQAAAVLNAFKRYQL